MKLPKSQLIPAVASALALVLAAPSCSPKPESLIPKIQQESQHFQDSVDSLDVNVAGEKMHPLYKKLHDDDVAMVLKCGITQTLKKEGYELKSTNVGIPQIPQVVDGTIVSFVPVRKTYDDGWNTAKVLILGLTSITVDAYLVATSTNKGKSWTFFETTPKRDLIDKVLPDLAGKLVIPPVLFQLNQS